MKSAHTGPVSPTLILDPVAPSSAPPPAHFEMSGSILMATVFIVAAVVGWFIARKRGVRLPTVSLPKWHTPPESELCDRAFGRLSRHLGLGGRDQKLVRRMAEGIGQAPVALLISPTALEQGAAALKRTWQQAEQYPEREIATLAALEQKLHALPG